MMWIRGAPGNAKQRPWRRWLEASAARMRRQDGSCERRPAWEEPPLKMHNDEEADKES